MSSESESEVQLPDDVASKIRAFKVARDIEQIDFDVYVYRVRSDSNKKKHNPFLHKYENHIPDELEIAEKFRGGVYKLQAIWYEKLHQKSESWSYEIDEVAFPPVPVSPFPVPVANGAGSGDMTQNLMFMVADIVKTAYTRPVENSEPRRDPLELFGEVSDKMQSMYGRMIDIQTAVMEKSFQMKLEKSFGLTGDQSGENQTIEGEEVEKGFLESGVLEVVKQIVEGAKMIMPMIGFPAAKPVVESIKKNPAFSKYIELAKNPVVVAEVAGALRREYGDKKAALLLKSFGINMVPRPGVSVSAAPAPAAARVSAGKSQSRPGTNKPELNNKKKLSNVKKG